MKIRFFCILVILIFIITPIIGQTALTETKADVASGNDTNDTTQIANSNDKETAESEVKSQLEERRETLLYGLDGEVISLITTLISEKDDSLLPEITDLFETVRNFTLREKIIAYFMEFNDPGLRDYALYVLKDPYDEKTSTVNSLINYVGNLKITEAAPLLQDIIESENEAYFNAALDALGEIGGDEEAQFLVEYLENDLSVAQKQALVQALGKLKAVETYDALVEMAENEDENTFVRMYATEAIGNIKPEESLEVLIELYSATDPNLREYVIKGIAPNTSEKAQNLLLSALKDDHYKVRLQSISAVQSQNMSVAGPALLYRAKHDEENAVKYACYEAISFLNFDEGIDYLVSLLEATLVNDTTKAKVAGSLLKYDRKKGVDAVIVLASKTLADDKKKSLRYALGKEFATHENQEFQSICAEYLASADVATQGTGLDIYKKNPYPALRITVQALADGEDVAASIKSKAKAIIEG